MNNFVKNIFILMTLVPFLHVGSAYAVRGEERSYQGGGKASSQRAEYPNAGQGEHKNNYNGRAVGGAAASALHQSNMQNEEGAAAAESAQGAAPQAPVQVNVNPSNSSGSSSGSYLPY